MQTDKQKKDCVEELKEWQAHQYDPGYFTGGRMPVWMKSTGQPKILGLIFLIQGLFGLGGMIYQIVTYDLTDNDIIQGVIPFILMIIFAFFGAKMVFRKKV